MIENAFKADLHVHSTYSDGTLTPKEIVELAASCNLQGLSITDHDATFAYEEAKDLAEEKNILLVPGAEISAKLGESSVHVLMYGSYCTLAKMQDFFTNLQEKRKKRFCMMIDALCKEGISLDREKLLSTIPKSPGRSHIANELICLGIVPNAKACFQRYLKPGKPGFVKHFGKPLQETLDIIHQAGGKAFLAHPHVIRKKSMCQAILTFPFDGIECFYANFKRTDCDSWIKIARDKGWLISGGSDFHGNAKPGIHLGSSFIGRADFFKIFA